VHKADRGYMHKFQESESGALGEPRKYILTASLSEQGQNQERSLMLWPGTLTML
jgi:hypothetical protein